MNKIFQKGKELDIDVKTSNADSILYFLTNSEGSIVSSDKLKLDKNEIKINFSSETTKKLGVGANNIKIFALSNSVLKPDYYESSFLVTENNEELPQKLQEKIEFSENKINYEFLIIPIIILGSIIVLLKKKYYNKP